MYTIYAYEKPDGQKVYVGQTKALSTRHYCHTRKDPFNPNQREYNYPLSRGIRKYGKDYYKLIILEEHVSEEEVDEKEKYWIAFYDTYWNGYNQTKGGRSFGEKDIFHDDVIYKVIDLLKNTSKSYSQIQEETGISLTHIYNINIGERRRQENETYPIRSSNAKGSKGIVLSPEENLEIHEALKKTKISMNQLSKKYNCSKATISNINKGAKKCYHLEGWEYPIRDTSNYARENSIFKKIKR